MGAVLNHTQDQDANARRPAVGVGRAEPGLTAYGSSRTCATGSTRSRSTSLRVRSGAPSPRQDSIADQLRANAPPRRLLSRLRRLDDLLDVAGCPEQRDQVRYSGLAGASRPDATARNAGAGSPRLQPGVAGVGLENAPSVTER